MNEINKNSQQEQTHQIHITVPLSVYQDLKNILPEHGALTNLIRIFIIHYVSNHKKTALLTESAFDKAMSKIVKDNIVSKAIKDVIIEEGVDDDGA